MEYSSELIQTMRDALEAVMATVPADQSVIGLKAAVAQCILEAAAHGQTSFDGLVASASGQLQTIISMLRSPPICAPPTGRTSRCSIGSGSPRSLLARSRRS